MREFCADPGRLRGSGGRKMDASPPGRRSVLIAREWGGRQERSRRENGRPDHRHARAIPPAHLAGPRRASPTAPPIRSACRSCATDFELNFDRPITIIVGENGTGKSTFLEGIAVLAGYDEAGGGKGYTPVDHSEAIEKMGGRAFAGAARGMAAQDHQRLVLSRGKLVSRSRDTRTRSTPKSSPAFPGASRPTTSRTRTARASCDFKMRPAATCSSSTSRDRRCGRRAGIEFLKLMRRMETSTICQVVIATHSPMLMAYPGARLLRLSKHGLEPVTVEETDHYEIMREFCADPAGFVEGVMAE